MPSRGGAQPQELPANLGMHHTEKAHHLDFAGSNETFFCFDMSDWHLCGRKQVALCCPEEFERAWGLSRTSCHSATPDQGLHDHRCHK